MYANGVFNLIMLTDKTTKNNKVRCKISSKKLDIVLKISIIIHTIILMIRHKE